MSDYSKSQEYRIRDYFVKKGFKAIRVPLSGACEAIGKGDVNVEDGLILVDHKSTVGRESISLKKVYLDKIQEDAGEGNLGLLTFSFKFDRELYVALPVDRLMEIIGDKIKGIAEKC